ncbi:Uncharacterised protein [Mycobacterium tuberculosis]|nr:Uncharacterised protein [Mycobacterium tuberculosis]
MIEATDNLTNSLTLISPTKKSASKFFSTDFQNVSKFVSLKITLSFKYQSMSFSCDFLAQHFSSSYQTCTGYPGHSIVC